MKLNNTIINQIFAQAGIKNHRLLNKHNRFAHFRF